MNDDEADATTKAVGLSTRDLVIQANTKLDLLGPEIAAIREEQARQRTDIDELKKARAVDEAEDAVLASARRQRWSRTEKAWGFIGGVAMLFAVTFGPRLAELIH